MFALKSAAKRVASRLRSIRTGRALEPIEGAGLAEIHSGLAATIYAAALKKRNIRQQS